MDIELKLLRSFVAIYERGSISRAAEKLLCTQAAMSMRLKMLESEMGGRLFLRGRDGLSPTSRGSELYAKALSVLAAYDEMISATRSRVARRRIRLGVPDDYALGLLSGALRRLRDEGLEAELEIVCDLSASLAAALHRQDLDLAVVTLAARPPAAELAIEARLLWLAHAEFAPDADGTIPLAAYPEGCVFRREMIRALEAAGLRWRVAAQSRSHAGIMSAVRAGLAVTACAEGTAPGGLIASAETGALPRLDPIPIYLLGGEANGPCRRLAKLVRDELEAAFAPAR